MKTVSITVNVFLFLVTRWTLVSSQLTSLTDVDNAVTTAVDNYFDKQAVIPLQTITDTMTIDVAMNLVSINNFDDNNERIEVAAFLTLTWTEERIPRTASALSSSLEASKLWVPSLTLINCACSSSDSFISAGSTLVKVDFNTGVIVWKPWFYGTVICEPNMKYFPFDDHECLIKFSPTDHTSSEILLAVTSANINKDYYSKSNEWTIQDTSARSYQLNSKSIVEFKMTLRRNPRYLILIILVPIISISILNVFVFHVPARSNQRLFFSVTNLLGIVLLFALVTFYIPNAAVSMSIILFYVFVEILINVILVVVVILSERLHIDMQFCRGKMIHSHTDRASRSVSPRSIRRIQIEPKMTQARNTLSVHDDTGETGPPPSAWDDEDLNDAKSNDTNNTDKDNGANVLDESTGPTASIRSSTTLLSFDSLCFIVFLVLHVVSSLVFILPLGLNV